MERLNIEIGPRYYQHAISIVRGAQARIKAATFDRDRMKQSRDTWRDRALDAEGDDASQADEAAQGTSVDPRVGKGAAAEGRVIGSDRGKPTEARASVPAGRAGDDSSHSACGVPDATEGAADEHAFSVLTHMAAAA